MDKTIDVASEDVIKLILQYLKENRLMKSLLMLQEESGISLNSVSNVESVVMDARMGRWNQVLDAVDTMKLSQETLFKLYDQIVRELVDLKEVELATSLMEKAVPLIEMRTERPDNHTRLLNLCKKRPHDSKEIYASIPGIDGQQQCLTKDKRRAIVGEALKNEIESVPHSRLLALIGMAIKWQNYLGVLPNGEKFDVFRNVSRSSFSGSEQSVKSICKIIKFGGKSHPECVTFTPDGQHLISGSSDGFLEVWDWSLGALDTELEYQRNDQFMLHDSLISSLAVSRDSEILASGSKDGQIKVWKLSTGQCLMKIDGAHDDAVTCISFGRDSASLLTGSFDRTARVHGLRSGKTLRRYVGHLSTINSAIYSYDGHKVITGSSDGYIKVWDSRTTECLKSFSVRHNLSSDDLKLQKSIKPINSVMSFQFSGSEELILVCTRSTTCFVLNLNGDVIRRFGIEETEHNSYFVDVAASRRCSWIYCLGQDDKLYCFDYKNGGLESSLKVHEKEAIGIVHHPSNSILASWGLDGTIKLIYP